MTADQVRVPVTAEDSEAVLGFFDALAPEADEAVVLSVVYDRAGDDTSLRHASLIVGPASLADSNWARWRTEHTVRLAWDFGDAKNLAPDFVYEDATFVAGRAILDVPSARSWLEDAARQSGAPAVGKLPSAEGPLYTPASQVRVFPRLWTPTALLVTETVRPVSGFFFPTEARGDREFPRDWQVGDLQIMFGGMTALGIHLRTESTGETDPPPFGLLVARMERRAWFNDIRGSGDFDLYELHVGWEPERCDIEDLEVELEEWVGDELAYARRVALSDLEIGDTGGATSVVVSLPTLGRGVSHGARLHHRDGTLLDVTKRSHLIQQINLEINIRAGGSEEVSATEHVSVGKVVRPTVSDRLERFEVVERQYREMLEAGLSERIISDPATASALIRRQLERARTELRVLDPYFGVDPADWTLLHGLAIPVRVLTGHKAQPPGAIAGVTARRAKSRKRPPHFHDRLYLWDGGGLSVGTSPSGLGKRDARVDRISGVEAAGWTAMFETYWASGDYEPL